MKINLLPEEYRPVPSLNFFRLLFLLTSSSLFFLFALFMVQQWYVLNSVKTNVKQINEQLEFYGQSYQNVKAVESMQIILRQKENEVKRLTDGFLPIEAVINESARLVPDRLWFNLFVVDEKNQVNIMGQSDRMTAIANLLMDIENSSLFAKAELQSITDQSEADTSKLYNFKLMYNVEKAGVANGQ